VTASAGGEGRRAGKQLGFLAHLCELGIEGRWLGAVARRRPAAGGEVERWGSTSVPLEDGGAVGELSGNVVELRPGSTGVRRGRKRELHGGQTRRRRKSSGSSSGSQCKALGT
jgi:hypothetical protein